MIACFPEFYPDELLYSLFARYYAQSGHIAYVFAAEDHFTSRTTKPDIEFINVLTPDAKKLIAERMQLETVIERHTMFPYYARFPPRERRRQVLTLMVHGDERYHNLLYMTKSKRIDWYLRYCPICAMEDREQHGETYWHRSHQMTGVDVCPWHHCVLKNSTVQISSKPSPSLDSAEEHVPPAEDPIDSNDELACWVAAYVHEVFQSAMDIETDIPIGRFFHSRIEYTKYVSPRGEQRNMALLFEDFIARLGSAPNNTLNAQWKLQRMFSSDRLNTYEVCLAAMFLGVPPNELTRMTRPSVSQQIWFDEKIRTLHRQGLKYPNIARLMGAPYDVVKAIGEGRY